MQVFIQETGGIFGFFLSFLFGPEIAGAEVNHEGFLQTAGRALGPAAENHVTNREQGQQQDKQDRNVKQTGQDVKDKAHGDEHADDYAGHQRCAVGLILLPELGELFRAVVLNHQGAEEGGQQCQDNRGRNYVGPDAGNPFFGQGNQGGESQDADGNAQDAVNEHRAHDLPQVLLPGIVLTAAGFGRFGIGFQEVACPCGQVPVDEIVGWIGQADHIGREEDGDHGNGHHNRVEEAAGDAQRHAQGGDDEGKLADLGKGAAALDGRFQRLAGE